MEIHQQAKKIFEQDYLPTLPREGGGCVFWTLIAHQLLKAEGLNISMWAGDMFWPIYNPAIPDDGIRPTHWSYVWSPYELSSVMQMLSGNMPELHSWCVIDRGDHINELERRFWIVDFSTKDFKREALRHGFKWESADPPEFLWGRPPEEVLYVPVPAATAYFRKMVLTNIIQVPNEDFS